MDVKAVKTFCAAFQRATSTDSGPPSNILTYSVGSKTFAYFKTSDPEKWRFSFRTDSGRFLELTGVPGVKPARYMGRFHWVTIVDVRTFPEDYLRELIAWSYDRALQSLSRRQRDDIIATGAPS